MEAQRENTHTAERKERDLGESWEGTGDFILDKSRERLARSAGRRSHLPYAGRDKLYPAGGSVEGPKSMKLR